MLVVGREAVPVREPHAARARLQRARLAEVAARELALAYEQSHVYTDVVEESPAAASVLTDEVVVAADGVPRAPRVRVRVHQRVREREQLGAAPKLHEAGRAHLGAARGARAVQRFERLRPLPARRQPPPQRLGRVGALRAARLHRARHLRTATLDQRALSQSRGMLMENKLKPG